MCVCVRVCVSERDRQERETDKESVSQERHKETVLCSKQLYVPSSSIRWPCSLQGVRADGTSESCDHVPGDHGDRAQLSRYNMNFHVLSLACSGVAIWMCVCACVHVCVSAVSVCLNLLHRGG